MTLQERVSGLDDYSGELIQALEKLEIENSRGTLNQDEQLDFLADLRRAMVAKDLVPLKRRGRITLLLSLVLGGGAALVPPNTPNQLGIQLGALGAAVLCLALSIWNFIRFFKRRQRDEAWLGAMEAAAAKGGSIFDVG
ncbi:MAG: hypothetical protein KGN80_06500 [Acidobacteriota bacterium]|nr:hypothetical protein [Acidobacteriota bacterium]